MGLAFSHFPDRNKIQPSLKNIYKELESEGFKVNHESGDLTSWAEQGVFLINTALTVRQGEAGSHTLIWKGFTSALFEYLNERNDGMIIVMWGNVAQSYSELFDDEKHRKIMTVHPSPLSANRGFFGSNPFTKVNKMLTKIGKEVIDWNLN